MVIIYSDDRSRIIMKNNAQINMSLDILNQDFVEDRKKHLDILKKSFRYVFGNFERNTQKANDMKQSILEEFGRCNIFVEEDDLENPTSFIVNVLNIRQYCVIITDAYNKQVIYTNDLARAFLYDMDSKKNLSGVESDLLHHLVNLNLKDDEEHHMEHKSSMDEHYFLVDSFVFRWNDKESFFHFISDETHHQIQTMVKNDREKIEILNRLYIDQLTQCYNKRYILGFLHQEICRKKHFSIVSINLNGIGYVNRTFGYERGNEYILYLIRLIRQKLRDCDTLARCDGDEFLLILENCDEITATLKMRELNEIIQADTPEGNYGISYGIKEISITNILDLFDIVKEVEKKMNFYKRLQRARYSDFDDTSARYSINNGVLCANESKLSKDPNLNIINLAQYEIDREVLEFDKICVGRIETADVSIAVVGGDTYYKTVREVLIRMDHLLHKVHMRLYTFDYKTFMIAATSAYQSDEFLIDMKKLSEIFSFINLEETGVSSVLRFVAVLNHENLLETGIALLIEKQKEHGNFFIYDENAENRTLLDESKAIDIIQDAINNQGIVPYYQGIRNNRTGKIDTYEALMRIVDTEGKVYGPYFFLDIAKKYKFYEKFTYLLVERVFEEFRDRTERVSINMTTSDIKAEEFRTWFYKKLDDFPNPHRLVLELVESEDYDNDEVLTEFMGIIRGYGVKLAIDDFGAGYSNLGKVINLKPDIIKIDGSIIKIICSEPHSEQILNVIVSMAKILNAYVVAEFIENEEIQEVIVKFNISYSQGYYYAKPVAVEELPEVLLASEVQLNFHNNFV